MSDDVADFTVRIVDSEDAADHSVAVTEIAQTILDAFIPKSLFDANTLLKADADNVPLALTIPSSTFVARLAAGGVKAATVSEVKTLLALASTDISDFATAVQALLSQFDTKQEVAYATAAALPTNNYANGSSGVGATLTGTALGVLSVDGIVVLAGQRVLVQNESDASHNGIYTVTNPGVALVSAYVLTRATDADSASELGPGDLIPVKGPLGSLGVANDNKVFLSASATPFVVGTTLINFSLVGAVYTAGNGLVLTGTSFALANAPTVTGEITASDFKLTGLTGAVQAARIAGATVSGAPTTGTFGVGDAVIAQDGGLFVCTVAGTPGTWRDLSSGRELTGGYAEILSSVSTSQLGAANRVDAAGLIITCTVGTRPIVIKFRASVLSGTIDQGGIVHIIEAAAGDSNRTPILQASGARYSAIANAQACGDIEVRLAPSAGSHTYKIQFNASTGGTFSIVASSTQPAFIQAVEC